MIIILMGVSGSGKTTIGLELSKKLGWRFTDADDLHPDENVEKMSKGVSLNDQDRYPWLLSIHHLLKQVHHENSDIIVACSALKNSYRHILIYGDQLPNTKLKNIPENTATNFTTATNVINNEPEISATTMERTDSNIIHSDSDVKYVDFCANKDDKSFSRVTPVTDNFESDNNSTSKNSEDKTNSSSNLKDENLCKSVIFVYLQGSIELIGERILSRKNHFMSANLLQSQFDTLELPTTTTVSTRNVSNNDNNNIDNQFEYVCIDIRESPSEIAMKIINYLTTGRKKRTSS